VWKYGRYPISDRWD